MFQLCIVEGHQNAQNAMESGFFHLSSLAKGVYSTFSFG
jgi:hypothetical protein